MIFRRGAKMRSANRKVREEGFKDLADFLKIKTNAGVSECELGRYFDVSRLTIRHWKSLLNIVVVTRATIKRRKTT